MINGIGSALMFHLNDWRRIPNSWWKGYPWLIMAVTFLFMFFGGVPLWAFALGLGLIVWEIGVLLWRRSYVKIGYLAKVRKHYSQLPAVPLVRKIIVEATSLEQQGIWKERPLHCSWISRGERQITVGEVKEAGMVVVISLEEITVSGSVKILFWRATSQVVDHRLIDKWFDTYYSGVKRVNAQNFCFHDILPQREK